MDRNENHVWIYQELGNLWNTDSLQQKDGFHLIEDEKLLTIIKTIIREFLKLKTRENRWHHLK